MQIAERKKGEKVHRCPKCNHVLGVYGEDYAVIRYKGRVVHVLPEGNCTVRLTCNNPACQATSEILLRGLDKDEQTDTV